MTHVSLASIDRQGGRGTLQHLSTLRRAMLPMDGCIAEHVPAVFSAFARLIGDDEWSDVTYVDLTAGSCLLPLLFGAAGVGRIVVNDPAPRTTVAARALFGGRTIEPALVRELLTCRRPKLLAHVPTFHFACDYLTEPVADAFDRLYHADIAAPERPGVQYLALLWALGFAASVEEGFRVLMTHAEDQLLALPEEDWRPYLERARRPLDIVLGLVEDVNAAIRLQAAECKILADDMLAIAREIDYGRRAIVAINPPTNGLDEYVIDDQIVHSLIANRWLPLRMCREDARTFWATRLDAALTASPPGALCLVWGGDGAIGWDDCLALWRRHAAVRHVARLGSGDAAPGWAIVEAGGGSRRLTAGSRNRPSGAV